MRIALIGASPLTMAAAHILVKRRNDVLIIERDKQKIEALSESIDAGFIHGDGTKPAILREAGPEETDVLLCLTDNDQSNILASLVGRSLGFKRVVPKIEDPEYEHICLELGLTDTIIPDRTIARTLADLIAGEAAPELGSILRHELRGFTFVAREEDAGPVGDLKLPDRTKVVCLYRDSEFELADAETEIRPKDEVVLLTHRKNLPKLQDRWAKSA